MIVIAVKCCFSIKNLPPWRSILILWHQGRNLIDPDIYGKYASSHLSSCDVKLTGFEKAIISTYRRPGIIANISIRMGIMNGWASCWNDTPCCHGVCMKYLKNEEDARDSVQQIFIKVLAELKNTGNLFQKLALHGGQESPPDET